MSARRMGSKSLILLALFLGTVFTPGAASSESLYPVLLRRTPQFPGAMWYSARLSVPEGRAYWLEITARLGAPELTSACLTVVAYKNTWTGGGSYSLWRKNFTSGRVGRYAVVTFDSQAFTNHPLLPPGTPNPEPPVSRTFVREGTERDSRSGKTLTHRVGGRGENKGLNRDDLQDVVIFCAADVPILSSQATLRADKDVRILKESWGGGTGMFREWDFTGGAYAHASDQQVTPVVAGSWEALAMAGGSKTIRFRRRAVGWFHAGYQFPVWVAPALLSWQGPDDPNDNFINSGRQVPFARASDWNATPGERWFPGMAAGRYTFKVEAYAMADSFADIPGRRVNTFGDPHVMLATADADFPACTALPVRSKASDGHPICG